MRTTIHLRVNGKEYSLQADPATPLLYILRDQLALSGPKYGCGLQQCGSCMVLVDGVAQASCMLPVEAVGHSEIGTIEGLAGPGDRLHPVQEAFVAEQAAQCGYCLNGMVIAAVSLLRDHPHPDDPTIIAYLQRNLCRCGTQARIIRAVKRAAAATGR